MRWYLIFAFFASSALYSTEAEYAFSGTHYIASYHGCDHDALTEITQLQAAMVDAVKECGATLLSSDAYIFPPHGLTMVLLLSESHASIHTYPEYQSCYIDLFTCGDSCDYRAFEASLTSYLKPTHTNTHILER